MMRPIAGTLLLVLSLFMLLGFSRADLPQDTTVILLSVLVAVVLPFAGGVALIVSHRRARRRLDAGRKTAARHTVEAEVLKLAAEKGGRLAVVEVVAALALDADTARETLESLATRGMAEVELTESGVMVFAFYDLQHLDEKDEARGVLDA